MYRYEQETCENIREQALYKAAYRAKAKLREKQFHIPHFPNHIRSLEDIDQFLKEHPEALIYFVKAEGETTKHQLKTVTLPAADGDTTLLWYDEKLMKELTDVDFFGDGTFL